MTASRKNSTAQMITTRKTSNLQTATLCDSLRLEEDPPVQDQRPEHCSGPYHIDRVRAGVVAAMGQSLDPPEKMGDPQAEDE